MKVGIVFAAILIVSLAVVPAFGQTLFTDDFEAGTGQWTNQASFATLTLDGTHVFGTQAAFQNTDKPYLSKALFAATAPGAGQAILATWWMYDSGLTGTVEGSVAMFTTDNEYAQIRVSSSLANALGISLNTYTVNYGKVGVSDTPADTGIQRTVGWHELAMMMTPTTALFYIDGQLADQRTRVGAGKWDNLRIGSNLKSTDSAFWYDNVSVEVVPEPASLLALGAGVVGLFGVARRRGCK